MKTYILFTLLFFAGICMVCNQFTDDFKTVSCILCVSLVGFAFHSAVVFLKQMSYIQEQFAK
jgi:hypothetical protein